MKNLLIVLFVISSVLGCSKDEESSGLSVVKNKIPSTNVSQAQKDTWHSQKVSMASVQTNVLDRCELTDDGEDCYNYIPSTAPNLNDCIFRLTRVGDENSMRNESTVTAENAACPIKLKHHTLVDIKLEGQGPGQSLSFNQSQNTSIEFKTTDGWPPGFDITNVNIVGAVAGNMLSESGQVEGTYTYSIAHGAGTITNVYMAFALVPSTNGSEDGNIYAAVFVEGAGLNFGAEMTIVDNVETYSVNNQPVSKQEFEEYFGELMEDTGSGGLLN